MTKIDMKKKMQEETFTEVQDVAEKAAVLKEMTGDLKDQTVESGKVMDETSDKIKETEINVDTATEDLSKSADYKAAIRKKQCIIFMIIVAILIAVGVIIYVVASK